MLTSMTVCFHRNTPDENAGPALWGAGELAEVSRRVRERWAVVGLDVLVVDETEIDEARPSGGLHIRERRPGPQAVCHPLEERDHRRAELADVVEPAVGGVAVREQLRRARPVHQPVTGVG